MICATSNNCLPSLHAFALGYYEYQADFGWVNKLENNRSFTKEVVWSTGLEYMLSRNFSLMGSYDNRFGGLSVRF